MSYPLTYPHGKLEGMRQTTWEQKAWTSTISRGTGSECMNKHECTGRMILERSVANRLYSFAFHFLVSKGTAKLGLMLQAINLCYMKILYNKLWDFTGLIDTCFWPIRSQCLLQIWPKLPAWVTRPGQAGGSVCVFKCIVIKTSYNLIIFWYCFGTISYLVQDNYQAHPKSESIVLLLLWAMINYNILPTHKTEAEAGRTNERAYILSITNGSVDHKL